MNPLPASPPPLPFADEVARRLTWPRAGGYERVTPILRKASMALMAFCQTGNKDTSYTEALLS